MWMAKAQRAADNWQRMEARKEQMEARPTNLHGATPDSGVVGTVIGYGKTEDYEVGRTGIRVGGGKEVILTQDERTGEIRAYRQNDNGSIGQQITYAATIELKARTQNAKLERDQTKFEVVARSNGEVISPPTTGTAPPSAPSVPTGR